MEVTIANGGTITVHLRGDEFLKLKLFALSLRGFDFAGNDMDWFFHWYSIHHRLIIEVDIHTDAPWVLHNELKRSLVAAAE